MWLEHLRLTSGPTRRYRGTRSPIVRRRRWATRFHHLNCAMRARSSWNRCWHSTLPGEWRPPSPCSIATFATMVTRPSLSRRLLYRVAAQWPIQLVPTRPSLCLAVATMTPVTRRLTASYPNPTIDLWNFSLPPPPLLLSFLFFFFFHLGLNSFFIF